MPIQIPSTPILQSQSSGTPTAGVRSPMIAVITASKRKGIFYGGRPRTEQQLEVPMLSLAQAEESLYSSESGSVMLFVHSEPQQLQGRGTAANNGHKFHHLYISFKYRSSMIHYEYFWVHLKVFLHDARRMSFHVEQRHFDQVFDLHSQFIPSMRSWLSAIVKAANFVDQPVQSVDLKAHLKVRHHLITTRRTSKAAQVVFCKLDSETKKIVSMTIDFDFKTRSIRDENGNSVASFHEVFNQFLGFHHGKTLLPSPREEDEEEPLTAGVLDGFQDEASSPKTKLRTLQRLQSRVRQAKSLDTECLELWTTFLLPQLMDSSKTGKGKGTPHNTSSAETMPISNLSNFFNAAAENGFGTSDLALEAPLSDIQVLICDILAELCDFNVTSVGPHIWRMCKGYLEDPTNWHACLAGLELLTLLSKQLAEWLVQSTDASMRLFWVVVEAQQLLGCQREAALASSGKVGPQVPQRPGLPRNETVASSNNTATNSVHRRSSAPADSVGSVHVATMADREQSRRGAYPPQSHQGSHQEVGIIWGDQTSTGSRWGESSQQRDRNRQAFVPASTVDWASTRVGGPPARSRSMRRAPSFDNFEDAGCVSGAFVDDPMMPGVGAATASSEDTPTGRRRLSDFSESSGSFAVPNPSEPAVYAEARASRPVRVPPLNLDLAAKLPGVGSVKSIPGEGASSMTRSSRRLRLNAAQATFPSHPGGAFGTSSRSLGSARLANSHTASAPTIGLRLLSGCFSSSQTNAGPPQQVSVIKGTSQFATSDNRQIDQQLKDLAKALGESCLLADLSHILKHKQERNVQEAVMERERQSLASPSRPIDRGLTKSSSSTSVARPTPGSPGVSAKVMATSYSEASLRIAAREKIPGSVPAPIMPGSAASSYSVPAGSSLIVSAANATPGGSISVAPGPSAPSSSTLAPADLRAARLTAFRRVRLHACLVLENFCMCAPDPAKSLGQHVPVSKLFEMLYASISRFGGCSFAIDDEHEKEVAAANSNSAQCDTGDSRQSRALLQQRLCSWRFNRIVGLHERLQRSANARRCVCGASSISRSGSPEDLCTCVDDVLASCIWQFLRVHALHVEHLQTAKIPAPVFPSTDASGACGLTSDWERQSNAWHVRLSLDSFLVRIHRALVQVLLQLKSAHIATTAGPDVIASLQHRLAFLLRLCGTYTRQCSTRVLAMQAYQTVSTSLQAVKGYLCSSKDVEQLSAPALNLWVAYLQLVGNLVRGVRNSGLPRPALGETFLVTFLDFDPSGKSARASLTPASATAVSTPPPPPPPTVAPAPRSQAMSPVPPRSAVTGQTTRCIGRSSSLRALPGAPPRIPSGASITVSAGSPRTSMNAERSPSAKVQAPRVMTGNVRELLPRVLERALFDVIADDALAAKHKSVGREESVETMRCRVLGFVEALLDFAQSLATSRNNASIVNGSDILDVSGDGKSSRTFSGTWSQQVPANVGTVALSAHETFRASMEATSGPLSRNLLDWMKFLFLPPSGLLCKLGRTWERTPLEGGKLVIRLILCEHALFRVPAVAEAVYVSDFADYYVRRHFLSLIRLYNSPRQEHSTEKNAQVSHLCCLHLQTLLSIASLRTEAGLPRRAFQQLSVLDFLAGEIDLEHDTKQMRSSFLRAHQQRQLSRQSAASSSSAGSCTSSPSHVSGGRATGGGLLTSAQHSFSLTPPVPPPLPITSQLEDKFTGSSSVAGGDRDASPPALATNSVPMPILPTASGSKKFVPKLQLRGLRPALQGSAFLGAPPPEEPAVATNLFPSPIPTVAPAALAPHCIAQTVADAKAPSGVPKLSLNALDNCGQLAGSPVVAPVGEAVDSGTGSTVASQGAPPDFAPADAEKNWQGSAVDMSGDGQLLFEIAFAENWRDTFHTRLAEHGIVGDVEKQRLLVTDRYGNKIDCFSGGGILASADCTPFPVCFPLLCKEIAEQPRRPPMVPKLLIGAHAADASEEAPSASSRSSLLGAGDPSATSPAATQQTTPFSSAGGSARRSALGSGRPRAGAPPPIASGSQGPLGLTPAAMWPAAPAPTVNMQSLGNTASIGTDNAGQAYWVRPDSSDSSSDEEVAVSSSAPMPAAHSTAPALLTSPPVESSAWPMMKERMSMPFQLPPMRSSGGAVPKLSFSGLRPSLQGCSGLGAPPPEEPQQPNMVQANSLGTSMSIAPMAAPVAVAPKHMQQGDMSCQSMPSVPLSPPPPSHSDDSDSSSDAPTPMHAVPDINVASPAPFGTHQTQCGEFGFRAPVAVAEPFVDSSDEEDDIGFAAPSAYPHAPADVPPLGRPVISEAADCDLGGAADVPALPPMPNLESSSSPQTVGGYQMRGAMPGLPGVTALGGLRQRPAAAVPKLSMSGLRPSLQGCSGLGAPPPEEPNMGSADTGMASGPLAPAPSLPTFLPLQVVGEVSEPAQRTPTGSSCQSPRAGSAVSVPASGADNCKHVVDENLFYFEGRQRRRIYEDPELHSLMLTLILTLLLTPKRGLLDSRYVEQYPTASRKRNVPFLLGFHLNHDANRSVLPWLSQQVEAISHIGGLRLLKLLCETAMHRWMYSNRSCVAGGQFGTVYRVDVQFSLPRTVAVKQIPKQTAIQDHRDVFADVFSEIACLDAIRFEEHVCQLFDYGVDETGYWIVMKYYSTTLKKWREALSGTIDDNLPVLLRVYQQVLRAVHVLHRHGVVHYDLKCDNIMIDPDRAMDGDPNAIRISEAGGHNESQVAGATAGCQDDQIPCISVADFGESRMMSAEDDLCIRNRGTEVIKCPEMLELDKAGKKEDNKFDRRRRTGTNQAADVWSLGCLLFELFTGRFLFQDDNEAERFVRVTSTAAGDIVTEANCRMLEGNGPLIEFIRYALGRNPCARPSISVLRKKFDVVSSEALRSSSRYIANAAYRSADTGNSLDSPLSVAQSAGASSGGGRRVEHSRPDRPLVCAALGGAGSYFAKVFRDLCVLEISDEDCLLLADGSSDVRVNHGLLDTALTGNGSCALGTLKPLLSQHLWTHVVDFRTSGAPRLPCQPEAHYNLRLPWSSPSRSAADFLSLLPTIFDFLRHAAITRGVVLFVDGDSKEEKYGNDAATNSPVKGDITVTESGVPAPSGASVGRNGLAMAAVLALVVETYQMAVFPALSHLSSQLLITAVRPDLVCTMAAWQESERSVVWRRRQCAVRIACLCGSCSWHIPLAWMAEKEARVVTCGCNAQSPTSWQCPNRGNCESYLRWLRARFGVGAPNMRFLWLPEGVAADFSDSESNGVLTRGIRAQAEPVAESRHHQESGGVRIQRFRCRSCQVLTHAEVYDAGADGPDRVALVCSYERLRLQVALDSLCQAGSGYDDTSAVDQRYRPPACFREARLDEVILPRTSSREREGMAYL